MDNATFNTIIEAKIEEIRNTLVGKAKEYAADHDRLHNFAVTAEIRDQNLTQALAGMMVKHTVSVYDMINSGEAYSQAMWDEKTGDHLVYLLLLQATIVEDGLIKREPGEINALYNKAQTSAPSYANIQRAYEGVTADDFYENPEDLHFWENELIAQSRAYAPGSDDHEGYGFPFQLSDGNWWYVWISEEEHQLLVAHRLNFDEHTVSGNLDQAKFIHEHRTEKPLRVMDVVSLYPAEVEPLADWERELLHGPHHEGVSSLNEVAQKNIDLKKVLGPISDETQAQIDLGIEHLEKERAETKSLSLNEQRAEARRQRVIKAQLMNIDGYFNLSIANDLGVQEATVHKYLSEPPFLRELPTWESETYRLPQEAYAEGGKDYDHPLSVRLSAGYPRLVYLTRDEMELVELREKLAGGNNGTEHWKFIYNLRKNPNLSRGFNRRHPETIQTEVQEDPSGTPPVIFQTKARAQIFLGSLKRQLDKKGALSYADYIRTARNVGLSGVHAFDGAEAQGWTSLFGSSIVTLENGGYTLALPGMVDLH